MIAILDLSFAEIEYLRSMKIFRLRFVVVKAPVVRFHPRFAKARYD